MTKFSNIKDIIDFAIRNEIQAQLFYSKLVKQTDNPKVKNILLEFVKEERRHELNLIEMSKSGELNISKAITSDLHLNKLLNEEYEKTDNTDRLSIKDALIIAGKREQKAFMLYLKIGEFTVDEKLKKIFLKLAYEEAKHKSHFEMIYDELI